MSLLIFRLVSNLVKVILFLWIGACGAATVPKSTCEFLLNHSEMPEFAREYVKSKLVDKDYFLDSLNPYALPGVLQDKTPDLIGGLQDLYSLKANLKDRGRQLNLLIVNKDRSSHSLSVPYVPLAFWVGLSLSDEEVRAASSRLGDGLIQSTNDEFTDFILPKSADGHAHFGVILQEWPDGSRSFFRFGFDVAKTSEIVIGIDVPCGDVAKYVTPSTKDAKYNDEWRVLTLHTNDGEYCRIPLAIFHRPALGGGTDRI